MPIPNPEPRDGYVAVGRVLRPWGLRGDLKVESLTDFPERFAPGAHLWLAGRERTVEQARSQSGALCVKLSDVDDAIEAGRYRNLLLEVPESTLPPLEEDTFYHHQLIGLRVRTVDGRELGQVQEVLPTGSNAVLVVQGPLGEVLLPFIDDVVRAVDLTGGTLTAALIEGTLPERVERPRRMPPRRWRRTVKRN
jgi:16S rRNA processing protein RimM